jgi:hypothetical protein
MRVHIKYASEIEYPYTWLKKNCTVFGFRRSANVFIKLTNWSCSSCKYAVSMNASKIGKSNLIAEVKTVVDDFVYIVVGKEIVQRSVVAYVLNEDTYGLRCLMRLSDIR